MDKVPHETADVDDVAAAGEVIRRAVHNVRRRPRTEGLADLLAASAEHPRWAQIAARCLGCSNCTMVCPTCYCTSVEDATDLRGETATRVRVWDSCFSPSFSLVQSGSVRPSLSSRYRHWMTHKLSSFAAQHGTSGCVGCGRCIAWCPAAIDITEEAAAIQASDRATVEAENERRRILPMQAVDLRKLLAEHPFLKGMDKRHVDAIADCSVLKRFASGDFLFAEGQEANNSYLIVSGRVELEVYVPGRGPVCVGTAAA
jgi:Fe-S-cluster-containing hydrogenase component 2